MRTIDQIKSANALIYKDTSNKSDNSFSCPHFWNVEVISEPLDDFPIVKRTGNFNISGIEWGYLFESNYTKKTCSICGETHYEQKYYYFPNVDSSMTFRQGKIDIIANANSEGKSATEIVDLIKQFTSDFDKNYVENWQFDTASQKFVLKPAEVMFEIKGDKIIF